MNEHLFKQTITGQFIAITLEYLFIELGSNIKILASTYDRFKDLKLTNSWVLETWKFCSEHNIQFEDETPKFPLLQKKDACLTDIFLQCPRIRPKHMAIINKCQLYLRAFTVSDITTGDGKRISHKAWSGIYDENTGRDGAQWPIIGDPTTSDWNIWRQALRDALCTRRTKHLDQPLGTWIAEPVYQWFLSQEDNNLYHSTPQGWFKHLPSSTRTRSQKYFKLAHKVELPDHTNLLPSTIFEDTSWIYAEGKTDEDTEYNVKEESSEEVPTWLFKTQDIHGSKDHIADAISKGVAVAVSDGSYKEEQGKGASASILTNGDTTAAIQISSFTPGNKEIQNAYRSELTGLLGSLQMIYDICKEYQITSGVRHSL